MAIDRSQQNWPDTVEVSVETGIPKCAECGAIFLHWPACTAKDSLPLRTLATTEQIAAARELYATDEINIDDDAVISDCGDGSVWVQAWVYVSLEEL